MSDLAPSPEKTRPSSPTAPRQITAGQPYPLGSTPDQLGTNFALFSDHAERVTLCLYDPTGTEEIDRVDVEECTNGVWHVYLPGVEAGAVYGYRVDGPWDPANGHRFNANKLLIDPYAKELVGELIWDDAVYGYKVGAGEDADLIMDDRDSGPFVPKARVVNDNAPRRYAPASPGRSRSSTRRTSAGSR